MTKECVDTNKLIGSLLSLCKQENEPITFNHLRLALKEQRFEYKKGEIIKVHFKIEKGKWYKCIKELPLPTLHIYQVGKRFEKGKDYYSPNDYQLMFDKDNVCYLVGFDYEEYFEPCENK